MPTKSDKFSSDFLPQEQMREALFALPRVLKTLLGDQKIVAYYGWSAKIHPDLYYVPMNSHTKYLEYLIEDSVEQRIVVPGDSDFYFKVPDERLEVVFCHESDIHLNGLDENLLQQFMAAAPFSEMHWNTREEVEKPMSQSPTRPSE